MTYYGRVMKGFEYPLLKFVVISESDIFGAEKKKKKKKKKYEGRKIQDFAELSIGDYVLTGGELPAMVLADCVSRFIPGVLGSSQSAEEESFSAGLLEYPQYTRPAEYRGKKVPEVLLNGNHAHIDRWRRQQSLKLTRQRRPDMFEKLELTREDKKLLEE